MSTTTGVCEWWLDGSPGQPGDLGCRDGLVGVLHRDDGPAISFPDGRRVWLSHGVRHRLDGPAVIDADGSCEWWVDGVRVDVSGALDEVAFLLGGHDLHAGQDGSEAAGSVYRGAPRFRLASVA